MVSLLVGGVIMLNTETFRSLMTTKGGSQNLLRVLNPFEIIKNDLSHSGLSFLIAASGAVFSFFRTKSCSGSLTLAKTGCSIRLCTYVNI